MVQPSLPHLAGRWCEPTGNNVLTGFIPFDPEQVTRHGLPARPIPLLHHA
jgi:hypothetical protein